MSKYLPLSEHLSRHAGDEWRASFADIEKVLGAPLPKAAQQNAWWAGEVEKPYQRAWLDHGWRVAEVDKAAGMVTFRRDRPADEVQPQTTNAPPEAGEIHRQRAIGVTALVGGAVAVIAGLGVLAARMLKARRA